MRPLAALLLVVVACPAFTQDKKEPPKRVFIGTETLKVGDKGELSIGDGKGPIYTPVFFRVNEVIDKDTAEVRTVVGGKRFLLLVPTADLVDDALIEPFPKVLVKEIRKVDAGRFFVLQPIK